MELWFAITLSQSLYVSQVNITGTFFLCAAMATAAVPHRPCTAPLLMMAAAPRMHCAIEAGKGKGKEEERY